MMIHPLPPSASILFRFLTTGSGKTALVQALATGHSSKTLMRSCTNTVDVSNFTTTIVSSGEKIKVQCKITDTVGSIA